MKSSADNSHYNIEVETFKNLRDSSESESDDLFIKYEVRKSRRKNLMPQKAVQVDSSCHSELKSSSGFFEEFEPNTVESENLIIDEKSFFFRDVIYSADSLSDNFLSTINNEDDIFKELQETPVNDESICQLKEQDVESNLNLKDKGTNKVEEDSHVNKKEQYQTYRAVKCNMCEHVFPFRATFDKHYRESYNLSPVYTCTFCNKTTEKYSTFRTHCYRHITEGRFKCHDCPKGFNLKSLLHIHVLTKHSKAKPFSCDQCGKNFVTKPGLAIHQKKHKTETKEDYPCVICSKILHTRGGLTSHMNVHRLGRRFMCDVCGKTFTQKVNMQQHVKQHTGDKPHICDKCGKTFAERSHLSRHYTFHSDQRPYKCDICQKMYKTERCLKVHSLVHASERPFVCSFCNKGFLSSTKLKQHSNIHTGERPYKCKNCERTFTNYPNLLKHNRRKHKLETNQNKTEANTSYNSSTILSPNDSLVTEIPLTRHDEVMIEQGLINVALSDEKYVISQPFDLLTGSGNNVGIIVPYFHNTLPSHQSLIQHINQSTLSNQFTDLLPTPCQSLSYE